jgi:hypothetical protein
MLSRLCFFFLTSVCVLGPANVAAAAEDIDQRVREFLIARYQDGRRLIEGPRETAPPPIAPNQSCAVLYQRRLNLLRQLNDYKPAYWDDRRNQAAFFVGTIWTPAFYFLNYTAVTARLDELDNVDPRVELDALRYASAQQRCFER